MTTSKVLAATVTALSFGLLITGTQSAAAATVHPTKVKVAKYTGFSSKTYRTGYLTNRQWNYTFYKLDQATHKPSNKAAFQLKDSLIPVQVKKAALTAIMKLLLM